MALTESLVSLPAGIPETFSRAESARALGCSLVTLDRMAKRGEIRTYRINDRNIRVNAEDVRAYFKEPSNRKEVA